MFLAKESDLLRSVPLHLKPESNVFPFAFRIGTRLLHWNPLLDSLIAIG
jgi:hypothetical protein